MCFFMFIFSGGKGDEGGVVVVVFAVLADHTLTWN